MNDREKYLTGEIEWALNRLNSAIMADLAPNRTALLTKIARYGLDIAIDLRSGIPVKRCAKRPDLENLT